MLFFFEWRQYSAAKTSLKTIAEDLLMVGKHIYSIQIFKPSWLRSQFELKFQVMLLILSCV